MKTKGRFNEQRIADQSLAPIIDRISADMKNLEELRNDLDHEDRLCDFSFRVEFFNDRDANLFSNWIEEKGLEPLCDEFKRRGTGSYVNFFAFMTMQFWQLESFALMYCQKAAELDGEYSAKYSYVPYDYEYLAVQYAKQQSIILNSETNEIEFHPIQDYL